MCVPINTVTLYLEKPADFKFDRDITKSKELLLFVSIPVEYVCRAPRR